MECGGKLGATPLWISGSIQSAVAVPMNRDSAGALQMENIMSAATKPTKIEAALPNSRRIYIDGTQPGIRVPFREIDQNPTRNFKNELEENSPVRVYDTSGPYGDPSLPTDVREGLPALLRD